MYNISSYIRILMSGLSSYKNRQGPLGIMLLESIGQLEKVQVAFNDAKISRLMKQNADVDEAVTFASTHSDVIAYVHQFFKENIVTDLNPHTKGDMFHALLKAINTDATTDPDVYVKLVHLLEFGEIDNFLATAFLYAINRPNKVNVISPATNDFPLLEEVNNECPLCHAKLIKTVKGAAKRKYNIVHIFPEHLDETLTADFIGAHCPSSKVNSLDNQIPLCIDDADDYLTEPTVEEYVRLSELKEHYAKNYQLQQALAKIDLEEDIEAVISALVGFNPSGHLEEFNMKALKINQKIAPEECLLKNAVQNNVLTYFNFIKMQFAEFQDFDLIQSDIKKAYKQLDNGDWTQQEIVDKLSQWILEKIKMPAHHIEACRIVISFFIQNCEVFHEISK